MPTLDQPSQDHATAASRTPHLGHVLLLLCLLLLTMVGCALPLMMHAPPTALAALAAQAGAYLLTLLAAWALFPRLWHRGMLAGIAWNAPAVRWWLVPAGLALGFAAQGAEALLPTPPETPLEGLFKTNGLVWPLAVFAVLLGPLFEEVVFRGFLLPALAIAVDWLRLPRGGDASETVARLDAWRASDALSPLALVLASIVTSTLFALVHAMQLGYSWSSVALLACVSLVLCWVRLRWRSVAASTVVHASYNLSVFVSLFVATGGFRHMDRM